MLAWNCKFKRKDCGFDKRFYYAKKAHFSYQDSLVESRRTVVLDRDCLFIYYLFSKSIRRSIYTTNIIENYNKH